MLSLLFKKNTLLAIAVVGAFAYPMFRSGELSVSKIASWILPTETAEPATAFDPYFQAPVSTTFRPASIGQSTQGDLPGSQGILPAAPATLPSSQPPSSDGSIAGQIGDFLGSIFETQTIDASGQRIPSTPAAPNQDPFSLGNLGSTQPAIQNVVDFQSPALDIRELIRFDITPYWVQERWPRVSAAPVSEEGFQGLRVPLTGAAGSVQMSGALTYFFDDKQTVQRIQFLGTVQQPTVLEQLCTQYFHFQTIRDMPGVLAPVHEGKPRGLLKFSIPVVLDRSRIQTTQVALEINSTRGPYQISSLMRQLAVQ